MVEFCRLIWCALVGFFPPRASVQAELLLVLHQPNVLRRKSPKRSTFSKFDRLIFAGLYGLAPNVLSALAIVKPETVIGWARSGERRGSMASCSSLASTSARRRSPSIWQGTGGRRRKGGRRFCAIMQTGLHR